MATLSAILAFWWVLPALLGLVILSKFFVNVGATEMATIEKRFIGKEMADGRTVALPGEVGVQAKILGSGLHFLIPFIQIARKYKYLVINDDQIGLVAAITGKSIPQGQFMAADVACNTFQDGEAFLRNGGEKGPQVAIIPPGQHRINPYLFTVQVVSAVHVAQNQIATVEAVAGASIAPGRIMAKSVECNLFQDGVKFLTNGGQKGPQVETLTPGMYRINTYLFKVNVCPVTVVPGGKICMVTAVDGVQIPDGRLLADKVQNHSNFEKGEEFLKNGGQKGRQIQALMPGVYRINPNLFQVSQPEDWTMIAADEVGVVTILEGKPITEAGKIAADEVPLEVHQNFQDTDAFLQAGGQKGLQIPVLRAGNYAINPWFARVKKQKMVDVEIGECAVVTNFVGDEGEDTSDSAVNAKIVENGKRGIWKDPLGPGKHALNLDICKVDIVPTTQILLSWANDESSAHKFDSNLKTITLRTADAFNVNMDVRVIIHIAMADAPKVIANLGSVTNMISQVLEPAISSHFRNAAQSVEALELYTKRAELQEKAKLHICDVLRVHHIESKDTMIADVVLPIELTKPVTDRQIAAQEKKTFETQKDAQKERQQLANATAQADMQPEVVKSERGVEISKNFANSKIQEATGAAEGTKIKANADATNEVTIATAKATAIKLTASASAEQVSKVGTAEAAVILAKGQSTAEAYKLSVQAMGTDYAKLKMIESIVEGKIKLIPENIIISGGGNGDNGGSLVENFLGLSMIEKLTGKKFNSVMAEEAKTEA
jgi:regulator of protease activity HflC (stomatin/prohibitin superfamily)